MKKSLILLLILTATLAPAAEEADPAMAALKRMRDQLRTIMLQQQKTEAERAALAAEKVTLEEKVTTLDANLKKLAKESNLQKETDSKAIADLQDKAAKQAGKRARMIQSTGLRTEKIFPNQDSPNPKAASPQTKPPRKACGALKPLKPHTSIPSPTKTNGDQPCGGNASA